MKFPTPTKFGLSDIKSAAKPEITKNNTRGITKSARNINPSFAFFILSHSSFSAPLFCETEQSDYSFELVAFYHNMNLNTIIRFYLFSNLFYLKLSARKNRCSFLQRF